MAKQVKYLAWKHQDLSLTPGTGTKARSIGVPAVLALRGKRQADTPASVAN